MKEILQQMVDITGECIRAADHLTMMLDGLFDDVRRSNEIKNDIDFYCDQSNLEDLYIRPSRCLCEVRAIPMLDYVNSIIETTHELQKIAYCVLDLLSIKNDKKKRTNNEQSIIDNSCSNNNCKTTDVDDCQNELSQMLERFLSEISDITPRLYESSGELWNRIEESYNYFETHSYIFLKRINQIPGFGSPFGLDPIVVKKEIDEYINNNIPYIYPMYNCFENLIRTVKHIKGVCVVVQPVIWGSKSEKTLL